MTTAILPTRIDPFTQLQQFCTSIGSLLGSVVESTDSAFRRVEVQKKDSDGNIKFYDKAETIVDPDTGEKKVVTKKVSVLHYIEDVKTGELYVNDSRFAVAVKCAGIALGTPFYAFGKICWYLIKTPIDIGVIALDSIAKIFSHVCLGRLYEASSEAQRSFIQMAQTLGTGLFEVVKAPLFALGNELAAIYGLFKPYHARKFEAIIEKAWQQGASYKEDLRKVPARPGENDWTSFVKDVQDAHPFYLAHCFQVRGNVNGPGITVIRRDKL